MGAVTLLQALTMSSGFGGKGQGKWKKKRPKFSELPEEEKEQIRAKWQERIAEENRKVLCSTFHTGEVVQRTTKYAWIKPANSAKIDACKDEDRRDDRWQEIRSTRAWPR